MMLTRLDKRLAALETVLRPDVLPEPGIDLTDDAAVVNAAWQGLRSFKLWYGECGGIGWAHAGQWPQIGKRAEALLEAEDRWLVQASPEEVRTVLAEVDAGRLRCKASYCWLFYHAYVEGNTPIGFGSPAHMVNRTLADYGNCFVQPTIKALIAEYGRDWPARDDLPAEWIETIRPLDAAGVYALLQEWAER